MREKLEKLELQLYMRQQGRERIENAYTLSDKESALETEERVLEGKFSSPPRKSRHSRAQTAEVSP